MKSLPPVWPELLYIRSDHAVAPVEGTLVGIVIGLAYKPVVAVLNGHSLPAEPNFER